MYNGNETTQRHLGRMIQKVANDIQMVFLDIDGTIYFDGKLVPSAVKTIEQLHQNGIKVALCTGRSVLHTRHLQRKLNVPYGIYFNGGLTHAHQTVLHATPFDPAVVARAGTYFERLGFHIILHSVDDAIAFQPVPEKIQPLLDAFDFPPLHQTTHASWLDRPTDVYQINVFMNHDMDTVVQNEFPECLIYRWDKSAIDLQRRTSDKSIGALALLAHLDIPTDNAVHIGDGGNDIGMFKTMGMSIAMGNAEEQVKQFAKRVTTAAAEDGVYQAVRNLGLI